MPIVTGDSNFNGDVSKLLIDKMTETTDHYGPDREGTFISKVVARYCEQIEGNV